MKKIVVIILCIGVLTSCMHRRGSGNIIRQNKNMGSFTGLNVAGGFDVEVKNGPSNEVVVEADDNLMKYIEVKVVGDELKIRLDNINVSDAHLKVFIVAPEIKNIQTSAAAEVNVKDQLKSQGTIILAASSGSHVTTALDAPEIKAEASSGGEINLSGRTKDFRATSSSGSAIKASELLSENSYATASSGGSAHVNASVSVEGEASSGGNISYRGAAASVKKSESSGGAVEKEN